ncbi:hypothetical protein HPB47_012525 [Ixodes persulcatus]|uniref:Uncharacterized protein n=1 Tax=Ixodes persulcatus TaxID=34615 RepID=A0AC60NTC4_IXOPE|nr:hypothetical protein HPB47_012525 [Ixodes persulcatus]
MMNASGETSQRATSNVFRFMGPGSFDPEKEDWNLYQIRFQASLDIAGTTDDAKKRNFLIASLGSETFKLLHSLVQPRQDGGKQGDRLLRA